MHHAYLRERKTSDRYKETDQAGFSVCFDELMGDHREAAFVIEQDGDSIKFVGYTLPKHGTMFEVGEIRNAFLAQAMGNSDFEDRDREKLSSYLTERFVDNKTIRRSKELADETRSVYKYKPVALKTKP